MNRVLDKVVLVTGGASGLGLEDARVLLGEGAQVVISDVNVQAGRARAADLGDRALFIEHDVASEESWIAVIDTINQKFGRLDVLINNAGIALVDDPETLSLEDFRRVNAVMNEGVFLGCKHAMPLMAKTGGGSIINMSSIVSHLGYPFVFAYSAAKGAVRTMTKAVAIWCQDKGYDIRCNSVHPGTIETPMVQSVRKMTGQQSDKSDRSPIAPGAVGEPKDIANLILFLASDESRFITGTEFVIDNGLMARPALNP